LQRRLAALRAVTELSQLFHPAVRQRWNVSKLSDATLLFPKPGALNIPEPSVPNPVATDLRQDLEACMQRLNAAGLELVVVDKTRPDIELCVAQVIIPGLVHMWQRNGPERLYRVAHELGWLDHPRTESELTPVALLA
jgi:ribosomal protein S12 methylthiotransferase accessory factor